MESSDNTTLESEVKTWLKNALASENISNFSIEFEKSNEKGEGYIGDVLFVNVKTDQKKTYKLVLKCSKRSLALRKLNPAMKHIYLNEIYFYNTVLPAFRQFELEHGIEVPFDNLPRYYGNYIEENLEVLVLENLKSSGYIVWDRRKPLDIEHTLKVMEAYGRYHAISVAFQEQKPDEFKKFCDQLSIASKQFEKNASGFQSLQISSIKRTCSELEGLLDPKFIEEWGKLTDKLEYMRELANENVNLHVLNHGDCWNNNFMYYYDQDNKISKVAILDWQMVRHSSPISDLSYFLFATISEENLSKIDAVLLKEYHRSFSEHLQKLGSDPQKLYPFEQLIADWKKYCVFGLVITNMILKVCLAEKEDVKSIDEVAERGETLDKTFNFEIQNRQAFKDRIKPIVKYAVENKLI